MNPAETREHDAGFGEETQIEQHRLLHSHRTTGTTGEEQNSGRTEAPLPRRSSDEQDNPFPETCYDIDRVCKSLFSRCRLEERRSTGVAAVGVSSAHVTVVEKVTTT